MTTPTLVLIDVQQEYFTKGRPFFLERGAPTLRKARNLLRSARAEGWTIIHVQHIQDAGVFEKGSTAADCVKGFSPLPGEHHVIKSQLSSYSAPEFGPLIDKCQEAGSEVYVAGYGSTMCCLATIITGAHFGHKYNFVSDASWARSPAKPLGESATHVTMTAVLGIHANVTTTEQVIETVPA